MTSEQIIRLYEAGFDVEQITRMSSALDQDPAPAPEPEPPKPAPEPKPDDGAPSWFTDFLARYNEDQAEINRRFQGAAVRHAEDPDEGRGGAPTNEHLMQQFFDSMR